MTSKANRELHARTVRYVTDELDTRASGRVGLIAPPRTSRPDLMAAVAHALLVRLPEDKRCLILTERGHLLMCVVDSLTEYGGRPRTFQQGARTESRYVLAVLREYAAEAGGIEALNIGATVMFTSRAGRLRPLLSTYRSLCERAPEVPMVSIFENAEAAAEFADDAGHPVDVRTL